MRPCPRSVFWAAAGDGLSKMQHCTSRQSNRVYGVSGPVQLYMKFGVLGEQHCILYKYKLLIASTLTAIFCPDLHFPRCICIASNTELLYWLAHSLHLLHRVSNTKCNQGDGNLLNLSLGSTDGEFAHGDEEEHLDDQDISNRGKLKWRWNQMELLPDKIQWSTCVHFEDKLDHQV